MLTHLCPLSVVLSSCRLVVLSSCRLLVDILMHRLSNLLAEMHPEMTLSIHERVCDKLFSPLYRVCVCVCVCARYYTFSLFLFFLLFFLCLLPSAQFTQLPLTVDLQPACCGCLRTETAVDLFFFVVFLLPLSSLSPSLSLTHSFIHPSIPSSFPSPPPPPFLFLTLTISLTECSHFPKVYCCQNQDNNRSTCATTSKCHQS
jgi:hypothetical protein